MKQQILYRDEKTGRYLPTKQPHHKFNNCIGALTDGNCAESDIDIGQKIAEYLKDKAWVEDEPKDERTQITFSDGINIGILLTAGLVWLLLAVLILYVGVRI